MRMHTHHITQQRRQVKCASFLSSKSNYIHIIFFSLLRFFSLLFLHCARSFSLLSCHSIATRFGPWFKEQNTIQRSKRDALNWFYISISSISTPYKTASSSVSSTSIWHIKKAQAATQTNESKWSHRRRRRSGEKKMHCQVELKAKDWIIELEMSWLIKWRSQQNKHKCLPFD